MSNKTDHEMHIEIIISENIMRIVPLILITIGTIGNILSIVVLLRKRLRKSTTSLYLTVLAFSDLTVLYTGLSRHWIKQVYNFDVRHFSEKSCKINVFVNYLALYFSSWLLVAVTMERVLVVRFPNSKFKSNKKIATGVICLLFAIFAALNTHILYGRTDVIVFEGNTTNVKRCYYKDEEYRLFYKQVFPWIDLMLFSGIPFCLLFTGNLLIAMKLISTKRKLEKWKNTQAPFSSVKRTYNTFKILFTLNTVFLVCTTPISISIIGDFYWQKDASMKTVAVLKLVWTIFDMMMYCNNTFNFLLYCISGDMFRQELKSLLSRKNNYSVESTPQL